MRPLLRVGHVNVNWAERRDAFYAMNNWLDGEEIGKLAEGTRHVPDRETYTEFTEQSIGNRVVNINPFYGNAFLGFHPDELNDFGIHTGDDFLVEINGKLWKVFYGQSYDDVPIGDWVAFPTASDTIMLVRNHRHAVNTAGIRLGDTIRIMRLEN
jgi:S-adenosylmethionine hydrolase